MAVISIYLVPFSPDYSGVSSVLFDLKTVTAMHDASGCTGNYTGYDEPRWYGSNSGIFCSGLREIDAVLGDDEKLVKKMMHAADDLKPELLALVGSPVPMVIGADLVGVAADLEARTGIPSLGFDTTGTAYYDKGVAMATNALLKKFTPKQEMIPGTVNIIGANPMDFSDGVNIEDLKVLVEQAGYHVTASLSMGYNMETLKKSASAQVNLVVSRAGLSIAEYMKRTYGIPYLCGMPVGKKVVKEYLAALKQVAESRESQILNGSSCDPGHAEILIVGEQVSANAIRQALEKEYGERNIAVGCIFGKERKLSLQQDVNLPNERAIKEEMNKPQYKMIIADPFMRQLLPEDTEKVFVNSAQYAVSSKICSDQTAHFIGEKFEDWYRSELEKQVDFVKKEAC